MCIKCFPRFCSSLVKRTVFRLRPCEQSSLSPALRGLRSHPPLGRRQPGASLMQHLGSRRRPESRGRNRASCLQGPCAVALPVFRLCCHSAGCSSGGACSSRPWQGRKRSLSTFSSWLNPTDSGATGSVARGCHPLFDQNWVWAHLWSRGLREPYRNAGLWRGWRPVP